MWYETTRERIYAQFRTAGYTPADSWRSAGIVAEFRAHEWDESYDPEPHDIGVMRIRIEPDSEPYDPGSTLEPFRGSDGRWRTKEELERELSELLGRTGVWGSIGEVWDGSEWVEVDSCCGHAGCENPDCPIENDYVVDHMAECLARRSELGEDIAALP